ncbi:mycofactocin system glycosyltransferase [Amycolatopsis sp. WAC 01416]|uniref:mycofactocin biosynthesis glycosyltransferase MftF n=1 Tax=Amycolatopsis sp. WAC 01416 TaxID=2203196 RepID=UPI000F7BB161|nr:mycofactocin biosynthesis glycosyltransferase MftF [Amycolatopsis sp. WAC 01416]RSN34610.1 mycofactocin system glycosyltransferase [Amycolatopsis sp. WAC 01416]
MTTPLPAGFRIALDHSARRIDAHRWAGGSPARVFRLTPAGLTVWAALRTGPVRSQAAGVLARKLTDAGVAHPEPPPLTAAPDVTVVIPVHDRLDKLARCLAEVTGDRYPVVLVDDASRNGPAVAELAERFGVRLVVRQENGGPPAARNTGLAATDTELVAFVDSDCVPPNGWIDTLAAHFADPLVGAVAPRVVPAAGTTWAGRYTRATCCLDLGDTPASVAPNTRVAWVPTTAMIVRREAVADGFDPALSVAGEDVDFVWRMQKAGWRVRYDPTVRVRHLEPETWVGLLTRRYRYGTSAAPLTLRHPGSLPPLVLHGWPTLTVAAALAGRPRLAAAAYACSVLSTARALRRGGQPVDTVPRAMTDAAVKTWLGIGRYSTQFALPLLAAQALRHGWRRRTAVATLALGPAFTEWARRRPAIDPARYVAGHLADDLAYGSGVLAGCVTHRTTLPLRPAIGRHRKE